MFIVLTFIILLSCSFTFTFFKFKKNDKKAKTSTITATVVSKNEANVTIQDSSSCIYTFNAKDIDADIGSNIIIEYTGVLNRNTEKQVASIVDYSVAPVSVDEDGLSYYLSDDGIFSQFYILANEKLKKMSLNDKIGQLLLVRYPGSEKALADLKDYNLGGFVFYENDFAGKTKDEVKKMTSELQKAAMTPLLMAVDEEGGKVVRVSSNKLLAEEKFKSPRELYDEGGLDLIRKDTVNKSKLLSSLGLNVNLAPVVDVSTNERDYMYERSIGQNTQITSDFSKTVIEASKDSGVSYVLKHFPGYGNNTDTHYSGATDEREYESIIKNDIPPFKAGIDAMAEAVLVSHNTVKNIDSKNPASLSASVHNLLRNNLDFSGVIITDDMAMGAVSSIDNAYVKALQAGNDIIMTTNYKESFEAIKKAVNDGTISEEQINKISFRILAWKYYKGLMFEVQK